jgi:hypothetical protein
LSIDYLPSQYGVPETDFPERIVMETEKMIEGSMKFEIIFRWPEKFDETVWKKRAFQAYTDDTGITNIAVLDAAERVAEDLGLTIPSFIAINLQQLIDPTKGPESVFSNMVQAVVAGKSLPHRDRFARTLRKLVEAKWPEQAEAVWYWRGITFGKYADQVDLVSVQDMVLEAIDDILTIREQKLPDVERTKLKQKITLNITPHIAIRLMKESAAKAIPV